jgi:hypothetical protein
MAYFALILASTLWISSVFGDDRLAIGAVLLGTWLVPMLIRRLRRASSSTGAPRKRSTYSGRHRASRGLHR